MTEATRKAHVAFLDRDTMPPGVTVRPLSFPHSLT